AGTPWHAVASAEAAACLFDSASDALALQSQNDRASSCCIAFAGRALVQNLGRRAQRVGKLTDCHYLDAPDNDGDSFRVRGGDKEFTARLYYVDAPETNLRHGDRTHDQSIHFGITLDETMKAGEKAKQRTKELLQKPFVIWTRWATAG